jgi:hypothetical protein
MCRGSLWLHIDEESLKIAHTICDADPRAKNKCHALRGIFDALPYLARQLSVFNRLPTEGYTQRGKF